MPLVNRVLPLDFDTTPIDADQPRIAGTGLLRVTLVVSSPKPRGIRTMLQQPLYPASRSN